MATFSIGVDVGSGSVRAGIFSNSDGKMIAMKTKDITIHNPEPDYYEQSSEEIWAAVCTVVQVCFVAKKYIFVIAYLFLKYEIFTFLIFKSSRF